MLWYPWSVTSRNVEMTGKERRAAFETVPQDKLPHWVGSINIQPLPPVHALQWRQWVVFTAPGQRLLLCVHLANWRPQTTKQTAPQVFKIFAPQWQWVYQASNSSAKWKITILWFYFVGWSRFPSGPHTELLWAPRVIATAARDGQQQGGGSESHPKHVWDDRVHQSSSTLHCFMFLKTYLSI